MVNNVKMKLAIGVCLVCICIIASVSVYKTIVLNHQTEVRQAAAAEIAEAAANGKTRIPIIMYHSLQNEKSMQNKYSISPDLFEEDLKYLKKHDYTAVFMQDVIDFVKSGDQLPEKPVVLTFDDGFYNNLHFGLPLLEKYNAKAVISVIGILSDYRYKDERNQAAYSYLTWDQIRQLSLSGYVEILNHSYDMHNQSYYGNGVIRKRSETFDEYSNRITCDIVKMQNLLEEIIGIRPQTFTYPFGAYNAETVDILKECGFTASLACCEGVNYLAEGDDEKLFNLNRTLRPHDISSEGFFHDICP